MKKMIIVSPETHSSLFLIKGKLQKRHGHNVTLDEVMNVLISHYFVPEVDKFFKLEEKE